MLFVDQQKAFDRINHDFLQIVLKNINFNEKFRNLVKNLFNRQEAHIVDSGHISNSFRVERGVRQGDPLSPLLYVLAFEPLLSMLDNKITGIKIGDQSFKCAAYADDLTIGISSCSDWTTVLDLFSKYEKASNARINKLKTNLMPLTNTARSIKLSEEACFKKLRKQDNITVLGYNITANGTPKKTLWQEAINKLKLNLEKLTYRNLSLKGKIILANSLLLSKIWYVAYLTPPNKKQVAEINRLITFWIKGNSKMLPRYSTFQQSYEQGGLQAPIVGNLLEARLLSVWTKLISSNLL
jgi:hypothetical protein